MGLTTDLRRILTSVRSVAVSGRPPLKIRQSGSDGRFHQQRTFVKNWRESELRDFADLS